ncbi:MULTISPECIES: hypothetical protein [Pseudomonas]|uniref:hypothetical protein n=1 Tax=Pseudomonas TaxID=286 RepID=UPI000761BD62|nr:MULTISPECIES: hypothetical protein [Pseudomonas]
MAYIISITTDELNLRVSLNFNSLSNEFRIVKICRLQCIGWILHVVSQVEVEVKQGAMWTNPEASVHALMKFADIPEHLARKLIVSDSTIEKFNLAWNHISDTEKNRAITINFDYFDNFWPGFQIYANAIALHTANTQELDNLKEEVKHPHFEQTLSFTSQTLAPNISMESSTQTKPIDHISSTSSHTIDRIVSHESIWQKNLKHWEKEDTLFV